MVYNHRHCNRSAVLQMRVSIVGSFVCRQRGLRTVLVLREQADDKADGVLLNDYSVCSLIRGK